MKIHPIVLSIALSVALIVGVGLGRTREPAPVRPAPTGYFPLPEPILPSISYMDYVARVEAMKKIHFIDMNAQGAIVKYGLDNGQAVAIYRDPFIAGGFRMQVGGIQYVYDRAGVLIGGPFSVTPQ